jgi:hypothetical protein
LATAAKAAYIARLGLLDISAFYHAIIALKGDAPVVDSATVREEVKKKYRDLALKPNDKDHFQPVEPWLAVPGYDRFGGLDADCRTGIQGRGPGSFRLIDNGDSSLRIDVRNHPPPTQGTVYPI